MQQRCRQNPVRVDKIHDVCHHKGQVPLDFTPQSRRHRKSVWGKRDGHRSQRPTIRAPKLQIIQRGPERRVASGLFVFAPISKGWQCVGTIQASSIDRPSRPVRIIADRDAAGHWTFTWNGYWSPSQATRAETRHTGKWDPEAGVMYSVRDGTLALAAVQAAFVGSDLARELERQGVLGGEAPPTYPVLSPSGDHLTAVLPSQAQSLVDRGLATWIKAGQPTLGLWMVPLEERVPVDPGDTHWAAKHTPSVSDVFGHWARRLARDRVEVLVLAAAAGRPVATIARDPRESHLFLAAADFLNTVRREVKRTQWWSRRQWAGLVRDWVAAVRSGQDPGPALWRAVDHAPPPSTGTAG